MDSFKAFVDKWAQPSLIIGFIVVVYGAIVWGNNLTTEALVAAKERGEQKAVTDYLENRMYTSEAANAASHARTAAVQSAILKRLEATDARDSRMESRVQRNESWINQNRNHKHSGGE